MILSIFSICRYEVSALYRNLFLKFSALLKMNRKVSFATQIHAIAHFVTCSEQKLKIMDKIINKFGIDYLQWFDENGDCWIAELEAVKFFGKEVFENYPNAEEALSSWGVDFEASSDENYISDCFNLINL